MKKKNLFHVLPGLTLAFLIVVSLGVRASMAQETKAEDMTALKSYKKLAVKPSVTDARIKKYDLPHLVYYDPKVKNNKILLWLFGTSGTTDDFPVKFLKTALDQGYRVVILSYITEPAVAGVCIGKTLASDPGCPLEYRRKRAYGDNNFTLIPDEPQDAILSRFTRLLTYLAQTDASGQWSQYLGAQGAKPDWSKIAVGGQSQGGGMAEFIAQNENVFRVVSFSGGWDYSDSKAKKIADWYYNKNVTPMANWYATYNVKEKTAKSISEICVAMKIPTDHVFALDKPLLNGKGSGDNPYHGDGVHNPAYKPIWLTMLGSGF
jgi:hypothetical protein